MRRFTVRFTDQRNPPKLKYEEIEVEANNSSEAIETASTIFFTKNQGELHKDFLISSAPRPAPLNTALNSRCRTIE